MANHLQLYVPVRQEEVTPLPPLGLTGSLAPYRQGEAYSGFLTIENPVGKCTVLLLSGVLPAGYRLYVDNILKRVYLKWDAYVGTAGVYALPNYSFEEGEQGWEFGEGWAVTSDAHHHGTKAAAFSNFNGTSDIVGPLISLAGSNAEITLRCQVQQGASSKGSVGAQVCLRWYSGPNEIGNSYGNLVDSASGGEWKESSVVARRPSGANGVRPCLRGVRRRQNSPLYADEVTWDFRWVPGYNSTEPLPLTIQVKDSLNRTATWSGALVVFSVEPSYIVLSYSAGAVNYASFSNTGVFAAGAVSPAYTARGVYSYGGQHWAMSGGRLYSSVGYVWTPVEYLPTGSSNVLSGCGTALLSVDGSKVYRKTAGSWGEVADFAGESLVQVCGSGSYALVCTATSKIAVSADAGATFGALSERLDSGVYSFGPGAYASIAAIPGSGQFVIVGSMWGGPHGVSAFIPAIAVTSAGGTSITATPVVVSEGTAQCVLRAVIDEDAKWLVGTTDGVFVSSSLTGGWTRVLTTSGNVASIAFDGVSFFVTTGSGVLKSSDLSTWVTQSVPSSGQALYVHTLTKE